MEEKNNTQDKNTTKRKINVNYTTFIISIIAVAVLGFYAGSHKYELISTISPLFGVNIAADNLDVRDLQEVYRSLKGEFDGDIQNDKLIDGAIKGMVDAAGDRYTVYMNSEEAEKFNDELEGKISGIGAEIGIRNDKPTVIRVVDESPAQKSGILAGDIFSTINGDSVEGLDAATIASKVRGEVGTTVKLTMLRGDNKYDFSIIRDEFNDSSVRWQIDDGIAVVNISRFDGQTGTLARQAAEDIKAKQVKAVILDLRNNGGGYLNAAQQVTALWLKNKIIVSERRGGKVVDTLKSGDNSILEGIKTSVLINEDSASASEIVAGALQDHKVATIIGTKSFGKGSMQKIVDIGNGGILKVTTARWYTPNGRNITEQGIEPDQKVDMTGEDFNAGRDPQLDAAKELSR